MFDLIIFNIRFKIFYHFKSDIKYIDIGVWFISSKCLYVCLSKKNNIYIYIYMFLGPGNMFN